MEKGAVEIWDEVEGRLSSMGKELTRPVSKEYLRRLSRLERIKEYRYPVMVIHTDDYEEITESFIRINRKGTRLREAEMAMAQLRPKIKETSIPKLRATWWSSAVALIASPCLDLRKKMVKIAKASSAIIKPKRCCEEMVKPANPIPLIEMKGG